MWTVVIAAVRFLATALIETAIPDCLQGVVGSDGVVDILASFSSAVLSTIQIIR